MRFKDVGRLVVLRLFQITALLSFIMVVTARDDVPILYWLATLGIFAVSITISLFLSNPYDFMIVIVPALVCVGAFMYDKLHIRHNKTLRKCYKILKHEGSYKQCYRTSVIVYDEYLDELEDYND